MKPGIVGWLILAACGGALVTACAADPKTPPSPAVREGADLARDRGCGPRPVAEAVDPPAFEAAFEAADLVFAGRLREIDDPIPLSMRVAAEDLVLDYRFDVYRVWKGAQDTTVWIRSYRAPESGGFPFTAGNTYLVYAVLDSARHWANRCTRTALVGAAYADLYRLGEPLFVSGRGHIPDLNRERLARALLSPQQGERLQAMRILEQIAPEDEEVLPVLLEAYGRHRGAARTDFLAAVGRLGPHGARAVPTLVEAAADSDATLRAMAVSALGKIGLVDATVLPALTGALADEDPSVRAVAAQALGTIGPGAAEAAPALRQALDDPEPRVRNIVSRSLQLIGASAP